MGTPIRSRNDQPPAPPPSSEELETPPNPNPNPSDGVIDDGGDPPPENEAARQARYIGILEETLREQNRTIQNLNSTPPTPREAPPAPPARDPAAERQEFYNEPMEVTRRIVRTELEQTVAPLLEFVKEMKGQGATGRFKEQIKNDPRFAPMWDAAVERAVDDTLARVAPDQINEQVVRSAVVQAIGLKAMGLLEGSTAPNPNPAPNGNGNPPTERPRVPSSPPHMRPSAPPAPNRTPAPKLRDLTENEERLRRENKMTKEDFLFWLDQPAGSVTTATPPSARRT